ncbi:MAG: DUF1854 domain-containing protein [Kiritimatiellae bacterium]|nr:DUF1854 domain-containing protein [Kiritimatiellia bacterium]
MLGNAAGSEVRPGKASGAAPADSKRSVLRVFRNRAGQLVAEVDGRSGPVTDVRVARCFPRSYPEGYISIRDPEGKEIALLRSLDDLDPESRRVVEHELYDKVFVPEIKRIIEKEHEFGVTSITAETDRGQVTFQIRSRDDVYVPSLHEVLFRDADGNVYRVPDVNQLDAASRRHLREYV